MSLPNDAENVVADDEADKDNNVDAGSIITANEDDENVENQRSSVAELSSGNPVGARSASRASLKSAASLPSASAAAADKAQRKGSAMSNVTVTSSSGLSFVSASGKKKKSKDADLSDGHKVTFTVTVAMALPSAADEDDSKKNKRILAEPKALAHYHLEYFLLPTDADPVKTDVTLYGIAAKVYPDKQEGKVLKTWHENGRTWVAWVHSHVIHVTMDLLKKLCYHKLVLRIWDTRAKFSPKAMYDKPRAFKLPPAKPGEDFDDISGVKTIILKQCRSYLKNLPKQVSYRDLPSLPELRPKARVDTSRAVEAQHVDKAVSDRTTAVDKPVPCLLLAHPDMDYETHSKLLELAKLDTLIVDKHLLKANGIDISTPAEKSSGDGLAAGAAAGASDELLNNAPSVKRRKGRSKSKAAKDAHKPIDRRAQQLAKDAAEYAKKYGVCSIHIPFGPLFIGQRQVGARLECPARAVVDAFAAVSVDKEVVTEEQRKELNPMSIKVLSLKGLPDTPLSYDELDRRCHPVHVRYDFCKHSTYRTPDKPHAANVYWNDVNVILLGLIPHAELRQYLAGPPMLAQVKDRDRIVQKEVATPALFGKEAEDEKISNVGLVSGHRTEFNALSGRPMPWDPYGVAHIDLSDLLLGQKILRITAPVFNCPLPDVLGRQSEGKSVHGAIENIVGVPGSVDGPTSAPLPAGHYVECHTTMKVRVEVSVPLTTPNDVALKPEVPQTEECPFGRLVYIFDYDSKQMVRDVLGLVTKINAIALGLDGLSPMVLDAALSTYKLSAAQQTSRELDIVTGFQVLDGHNHVFVLEGLKDKAIKNLWETLPKPATSASSRVTVLYNSDLAFSERLYGSLDVDLTRVKLHEPLGDIVRQPLLFVRDMVPKPCFKALIKLDELNRMTTLRAAVRNDLLPTAAMVISMSREFGVPLAPDDFVADDERKAVEDLLLDYRHAKEEEAAAAALPKDSAQRGGGHRISLKDPLDDFNPKYVELLESRQRSPPADFVGDNKNVVHAKSAENRSRRRARQGTRVTLTKTHNYSTQALNSTQLAIEKIRQDLDKDTLYTYNPEYHHSHTFVPVNIQHERKVEELASKTKWQSPAGWTYPGVRNLRQCNEHPRAPDSATRKELATEWVENSLHSNKLQPTLPERERFTWIDRREEFDLWKVPAALFNADEPVTIMLAGEKLKEERREAAKKAESQWRSKLVVDNIRPEFYRCNVQTEQIDSGRHASNELSRLQGLLHSDAKKLSYAGPGFRVEIPPLSVVHNPSVDTQARELGIDVSPAMPTATGKAAGSRAFKPGPLPERSWLLERNRIPAIEYNHTVEGYFNVYHNEAAQSKLHKRAIVPLADSDYQKNLFALPPQLQYEQAS